MVSEYFESLLVLCTFVALSLGVSHTKFRGVTGFGAGVIMTCAVLVPLVGILCDIDTDSILKDFDIDIDGEYLTDDMIETAFESGIAEYVSSKYGVDKDCVIVMADGFDMENMRAERIYITLCGPAIWLDYKKIENEISGEFTSGGICEVSLEIG